MRRITLWMLSTISALVLLFSYHTSTNARSKTSIVAPQTGTDTATAAAGTTSSTESAGTTSSTGTTAGSASSGSALSAAASSGSTASGTAATTIDGDVVSTRYGNVQVQITVSGGKITHSVVLQVPWNNPKDQQINSRAVPVLNAEAVDAQSAQIDMVSGATYTSQAYLQSLQSAIDKANL